MNRYLPTSTAARAARDAGTRRRPTTINDAMLTGKTWAAQDAGTRRRTTSLSALAAAYSFTSPASTACRFKSTLNFTTPWPTAVGRDRTSFGDARAVAGREAHHWQHPDVRTVIAFEVVSSRRSVGARGLRLSPHESARQSVWSGSARTSPDIATRPSSPDIRRTVVLYRFDKRSRSPLRHRRAPGRGSGRHPISICAAYKGRVTDAVIRQMFAWTSWKCPLLPGCARHISRCRRVSSEQFR